MISCNQREQRRKERHHQQPDLGIHEDQMHKDQNAGDSRDQIRCDIAQRAGKPQHHRQKQRQEVMLLTVLVSLPLRGNAIQLFCRNAAHTQKQRAEKAALAQHTGQRLIRHKQRKRHRDHDHAAGKIGLRLRVIDVLREQIRYHREAAEEKAEDTIGI